MVLFFRKAHLEFNVRDVKLVIRLCIPNVLECALEMVREEGALNTELRLEIC